MAKKKKKSSRGKAPVQPASEHVLPGGFWAQVGALLLIAVALLVVVSWFGAGGPVLNWIDKALLNVIGYAMYVLPVLFIYIAIEVFRAENNHLPFVMKFASILSLLWFAGLFGLLKDHNGHSTGGVVGDLLNQGTLALVNRGVAAFIYILLIALTALFIVRVSPITIIKKLWALSRRGDTEEQDANVRVMRSAAAVDAPAKSLGADFKVSGAVPFEFNKDTKEKGGHLGSFRNSVKQDKVAENSAALVAVADPNWKVPGLNLLEAKQAPADPGNVQQNAAIIKDTLNEFGIGVDVDGANVGPRVTQYTLKPHAGVQMNKISALEDNIAYNLAAKSLRIEAPIPGKRAVGIEVPNAKSGEVRLRGIMESPEWVSSKSPLPFVVGRDIFGEAVVEDLSKMPHLLIAGQTGAGKSVMINTLLTSLLYRNSPSTMRLILVDPKRVEMTSYKDIPHLLTPVITEPEKTISALKWAVNEMERRYKLLEENRVKNIEEYNESLQEKGKKITVADEEGAEQQHENGEMPYIVIVIDELADLMQVAAKDVEALIARLTAKARAAGIHLVVATQSPRANVITGLIKTNIPGRIAFTVPDNTNSRIILDQAGAEKLLGAGDMLILSATINKPRRIQGAWMTNQELGKITDFLRDQAPPQYNDEVVAQPVQLNGKGGVVMDFEQDASDDTYKQAVQLVMDTGKASASLLQVRLSIGYARASRYITAMEDQGIIGPANGSKPREVLVSSFDDVFGENHSNETADEYAE